MDGHCRRRPDYAVIWIQSGDIVQPDDAAGNRRDPVDGDVLVWSVVMTGLPMVASLALARR